MDVRELRQPLAGQRPPELTDETTREAARALNGSIEVAGYAPNDSLTLPFPGLPQALRSVGRGRVGSIGCVRPGSALVTRDKADAERRHHRGHGELIARAYGARDQRGVSVHRESLIAKGLIWSPRRGQLDFTVPLFAEYLRDNHPIALFDEA